MPCRGVKSGTAGLGSDALGGEGGLLRSSPTAYGTAGDDGNDGMLVPAAFVAVTVNV